MNKLFLIGNGFDLAHGLRTKYSDFLLGYVNKCIREFNVAHSNIFEDDLIILNPNGFSIKEFNSLQELRKYSKDGFLTVQCKSNFFNKIFQNLDDLIGLILNMSIIMNY